MNRFQKILFVYDRPTEKGMAFQRAVDLTKKNQAILTVVEVLEEIPPEIQVALPSSNLQGLREAVSHESYERLKDLTGPVKKEGIQVATKVLWGTPWLEIIREVLRSNHDLVMLSPQKKPRLKEALFGSRIMHLMRKCPCPVWAIKPAKRKLEFARMLAAVDVAPPDVEANLLNVKIIELAASLTRTDKSELHVLSCWRPYFERTIRGQSILHEDEVNKNNREARSLRKKWLNQLVERASAEGLSLKVHLLEGEANQRILDFAEQKRVEMIVMGTVSRTGVAGFFIGNTAEKVLHRLNCSVLAVKPDSFETPVKLE